MSIDQINYLRDAVFLEQFSETRKIPPKNPITRLSSQVHIFQSTSVEVPLYSNGILPSRVMISNKIVSLQKVFSKHIYQYICVKKTRPSHISRYNYAASFNIQ